jgi:hypothetical protein
MTNPVLSIPTLVLWNTIANRVLFFSLRTFIHTELSALKIQNATHQILGIFLDLVEQLMLLPLTHLFTLSLLKIGTNPDGTTLYAILMDSISNYRFFFVFYAVPIVFVSVFISKLRQIVVDVLFKYTRLKGKYEYVHDAVIDVVEVILQYPIDTIRTRSLVNGNFNETIGMYTLCTTDLFKSSGLLVHIGIHFLYRVAELTTMQYVY